MLTENPRIDWRHRTVGKIGAMFVPQLLNLLDYRMYYHDRSTDPARPEYNQHSIFVFWHEYIGLVLPRWGHTPLTVLCSQHRDGEYVNQIAASLKLHIVRGSSNRGGAAAIRQLKNNCRFSSIAITPDGPRGPRRELAMGPIYLAALLKIPIVPVGIGVDRSWRLNTWDQFVIPCPLARVRFILGPKIMIDSSRSREEIDAYRLRIQRLMDDLSNHAQNWAHSGLKLPGEQPCVRVRRCSSLIFDSPKQKKSLKPCNLSSGRYTEREIGIC
jgi:lysophospholipid acyltransferase (LPLAT)-like uncharacterized protein